MVVTIELTIILKKNKHLSMVCTSSNNKLYININLYKNKFNYWYGKF